MKHGGDLTDAIARHGAGDPPWLDLSTGINPQPWPVPDALRRTGWERLPARADLERLLGAARAAYRIPESVAIVAAPGTQALIQWLPRLAPPGSVAVLGPTYGEHAESWRAAGRIVREIASLGEAGDARHLVVVEPNNPDGRRLGPDALADAAATCARRGGWLVVDASFADVAEVEPLPAGPPVVTLRSFGKFYGLAGLRLGFALAPPEIARAVEAALGPWAVSGPALAVGATALADREWAREMRGQLVRDSEALDRVLAAAGLVIVGGTSLFRLARHPEAARMHEGLAAAHVWTRRFEHAPDLLRFGLPPNEAGLARLGDALGCLLARPHDHGATTLSPR